MEIRQLRYVVAVAEELHFGRAARREHITASALSQQVARLERELGVALFERAPRRVRVTAAGAAFVDRARSALLATDEAGAAARAAALFPGGTVTVGFTSHGAGGLMTPLLTAFAARHRRVEVRLRELDFTGHFTGLADESVDIEFVRGPWLPAPGTRVVTLYTEPRVVALSRSHRLAGPSDQHRPGMDPEPRTIRAAQLSGETFFRLPPQVPTAWAAHFAPWGAAATAPRISTAGEALSLVAAGLGVALLPASLARMLPRPDIVYRPAEVEPSALGVAWRPSVTTDAFAALAVELAPHHLPGD